MSYVDAFLDQEHDVLHVVERVNGKRHFKEFPINYTAYYEDHNGKYETIYGRKVSRVKERSKKKFNREMPRQRGGAARRTRSPEASV